MSKIQALYAYTVTNPVDGTEMIASFQAPSGANFPLIATTEAKLKERKLWAEALAAKSGLKVRLVRFWHRDELEEIKINSGGLHGQ